MAKAVSDENLLYILENVLIKQDSKIEDKFDALYVVLEAMQVSSEHEEFVFENHSSEALDLIFTTFDKPPTIFKLEMTIQALSDDTMIAVTEKGLPLLQATLVAEEVQKYVLPITNETNVYAQGNFNLYIYMDYYGNASDDNTSEEYTNILSQFGKILDEINGEVI